MPVRALRLPTLVTGSTWRVVVESLRKQAGELDNRSAVSLVEAFRRDFPLWYVYAGEAYGWRKNGDALDSSEVMGARLYPPDVADSLWLQLMAIADARDAEADRAPKVEPQDVFDDLMFSAEVAAAIASDGAAEPISRPKRRVKMRRVNVGDATANANGINVTTIAVIAIILVALHVMENRED